MPLPSPSVDDLPADTREEIANSFLRLRFRGGRFEGDGGMPLAAMGELAYLDELIFQVARILWRQRNNKKRMRADEYPAAPILRVQRFAEGSSIPLVERDGDISVLTDEDPYEESRDLVERTFWSIVENSLIPDDFPSECYDFLRRVGKTLRDDEVQEYLEHNSDGTWTARHFTQQIRSNFWKVFNAPTSEERTLVGTIESLTRPGSFIFRLEGGQKLDGKCTLWDDMYRALGDSVTKPICRLLATVEIDYLERITKITAVDKVEVFEVNPENWRPRFFELASYSQDWAPGAKVIEATSLERTDVLMRAISKSDLPEPAVFGSFDGGTNVVWNIPSGRVTVYIEDDDADEYEVELVPNGPLLPYATKDANDAAAKVRELINA